LIIWLSPQGRARLRKGPIWAQPRLKPPRSFRIRRREMPPCPDLDFEKQTRKAGGCSLVPSKQQCICFAPVGHHDQRCWPNGPICSRAEQTHSCSDVPHAAPSRPPRDGCRGPRERRAEARVSARCCYTTFCWQFEMRSGKARVVHTRSVCSTGAEGERLLQSE
jgi:hypothetical protein